MGTSCLSCEKQIFYVFTKLCFFFEKQVVSTVGTTYFSCEKNFIMLKELVEKDVLSIGRTKLLISREQLVHIVGTSILSLCLTCENRCFSSWLYKAVYVENG